MSGARRDYRSFLLRLYRVRKAGKGSWRASLYAPEGGNPRHFAGLSELVAFLEQEGYLANGVGKHGQAEEITTGEEGDMNDGPPG